MPRIKHIITGWLTVACCILATVPESHAGEGAKSPPPLDLRRALDQVTPAAERLRGSEGSTDDWFDALEAGQAAFWTGFSESGLSVDDFAASFVESIDARGDTLPWLLMAPEFLLAERGGAFGATWNRAAKELCLRMEISVSRAMVYRLQNDAQFRRQVQRLLIWSEVFAVDSDGKDREIRPRLWRGVDLNVAELPWNYWVTMRDVALIACLFGKDDLALKLGVKTVRETSQTLVDSINADITRGKVMRVAADGLTYEFSPPEAQPKGEFPRANVPVWLRATGRPLPADNLAGVRPYALDSEKIAKPVEAAAAKLEEAGKRERKK